MTIADVKKATYALIEELNTGVANLTDDPDLAAKMNYVINQVQYELSTIKRIRSKETFTYSTSYAFTLPSDFYQMDKCEYDYIIYDGKIEFLNTEDTSIDIYYYKYPTLINASSLDSVTLEITPDCLTAMVYGIAADLLKADVSVDYTVYATRYTELKNQLRLGESSAMVFVDTTNEVS